MITVSDISFDTIFGYTGSGCLDLRIARQRARARPQRYRYCGAVHAGDDEVGFCNVLVHQYVSINDDCVYDALQHELPAFEQFLTQVGALLDAQYQP